jgi:hypothetical protein
VLNLCLFLQLRFVLDAIITRQLADQLAALPIVENAIEIFSRDTRHSGKIPLADLLVNYNAARADILAEFLRQFE